MKKTIATIGLSLAIASVGFPSIPAFASEAQTESTMESQQPESEETQLPESEDSQQPETEESLQPETEESQQSEAEESQLTETEESLLTETEESQQPETEESQQPETEESQQPETEESQQPETEESQQPETEESQQPETEESQQPETEESQQPILTDPVQESETLEVVVEQPEESEANSVIMPENQIDMSNELYDVPEISTLSIENNTTTDFVNRLYQIFFDRPADETGLNTWVTALNNGTKTGADVIEGFVLSDEFTRKNTSDEEFVEILYNALLGRSSDASGKKTWVDNLSIGFTRNYVCAGFNGSTEFYKLCAQYGIDPGTFKLYSDVDKYPQITKFVSRTYNLALSRKPDATGLELWVSQLNKHIITGAQAVSNVIFSEEYLNKKTSDELYISTLYKVMLDREAEQAGIENWQEQLDIGASRGYLFWGFVGSTEFWKLCDKYSIQTGEVLLSEPRDLHLPVTSYVTTTYENSLERKASPDELNTWVQQLYEGTIRVNDFLSSIMFSSEMNNKHLSNDDFIKKSYQVSFHRDPRADEIGYWQDKLSTVSRQDALADIAKGDEFSKLLSQYELRATRLYQNPSQYYQIQDSITLTGGGYNLSIGYEGLKVAYVIRKLGLGNAVGMGGAYYSTTTANAVKSFQSKNGLPATGIVDINTWLAMGFSENDWYNLGAYVSPMKINYNSTRSDCIEAMISTAMSYLGTDYMIGASGKPGTGIDCSGLVMQALYSAGIDLSPINPVRHSYPGYEYESRNIWKSSKLMHVPYSQRQRGDLIFYQNSAGVIIHVAIYLGNDQVVEAWPNKVVQWPVKNAQRSNIAGVARPFV